MNSLSKYMYVLCLSLMMAAEGLPAKGQLVNIVRGTDTLGIDALYNEARFLYGQSMYVDALDKAEQALQRSVSEDDKHDQVRIMELMGTIYMSSGRAANALPYYIRVSSLLQAMNDTAGLVRIYSRIARVYNREQVYAKELEYHEKILQLDKQALPEENLNRREQLGLAAYNSGQYDKAVKTFRGMCQETALDAPGGMTYQQHLISAFDRVGQYDSAIYRSAEMLPFLEKQGKFSLMARVYNNIGYYRLLTGALDQAASAYESALVYAESEKKDLTEIALYHTNAGVCYTNMGKKKEAVDHFTRSIALLDETDSLTEKSRVQNLLANLYFETGEFYNAGQFSLGAIASAQEAGNRLREAEACLTYSKVLREGNDPVNALVYYEQYLAIKDSIDRANQVHIQQLETRRSMLEQQERDLQLRLKEEEVTELAINQLMLQNETMEQERTLLMQQRNVQLLQEDSLRQSLIILQQQNEVTRQTRENRLLAQENELAELRVAQEKQKQQQQEAEIMALEQKQRADQLELERQKRMKRTYIGAAVLLGVLVLSILASLISSRRKNTLLAKQKKEIEEKNLDLEMKNEEISTQRDEIEAQRNLLFEQKEMIEKSNEEVMKSIEYAKRIQAATLPDLLPLGNQVEEHFVLFRPRDIVSGDFYWYAHVEKKTIITVADCTGHGVPGAFMSMMGVSFLKELVQKEYITHPGVILRRLRKEIINTMGQKGVSGEQRDGMDMALISIDHEEGTLDFAGAYNSLYIVRPEDKPGPDPEITKADEPMSAKGLVLYEIPADKMPIAHYEVMDKFTNYEVPVNKGDRVYLFTDGYADQFGGQKGKKFMYKAFKRMIIENASKPMTDQEKIYTDRLEKWMGTHSQVDDICVMGVKI
jgi:serine phosphatase RsbU (regulator of sigma subunit)